MRLDIAPEVRPPFEVVARAARYPIRSVIRLLRIPEREHEDVAQKVLFALFRRLQAYDPARPLGPWLTQVAYRTARDHRCLAHTSREMLAGTTDFDAEDGAPDSEQRLIDGQTRRHLDALVKGIEARRRSVLVMHHFEGIAVQEIAATLGIPVATARTRLRLARADLHAAWERTHEEPRQRRESRPDRR